jgi:hypothetical protein
MRNIVDQDGNDICTIKGYTHFELFDKHGELIDKKEGKNLITTSGRGIIAARLQGVTAAVPAWMEVGTSSAAAVAGDVGLTAVIAASRTAVTPSVSTNVVTWACTFSAGVGTGAIYEAGIFNAASGVTLLNRIVLGAVINKGALDTLVVTWQVTIA